MMAMSPQERPPSMERRVERFTSARIASTRWDSRCFLRRSRTRSPQKLPATPISTRLSDQHEGEPLEHGPESAHGGFGRPVAHADLQDHAGDVLLLGPVEERAPERPEDAPLAARGLDIGETDHIAIRDVVVLIGEDAHDLA